MNKTLYKVIFNKKRGQMVAVAEHTARAGKSTQDSAPGAALSASAGAALRLPAICFSLLLAFGQAWIVPAQAAGIAADKAAPANQQPTILQTANGLPQVNIQTPTSAGVSVNQYRQFDVDGKGAILNNSRSNTATHTGGWIQGNPWLAGGEARVIVNQINSSNPSQLGGYIEVAGRRAEVIMANPAGIQVNGGGFINAAGITLTSGRPIINNGHLEGFRVRSGSVDVSGNGLDTSGADYTRILAQAATVNAGIWAQDLQISAGSNDIAANGATTAVSDGPSPAAAVAVDTGALGGMYAGKISLISTEKGVGIHNAGQLFAAAGGVSLAADGNIVNSGSIVAADKSGSSADKATVAIQAAHFHNSGSLSAQGAARIQTASLNNSGLLASAAELNIRNQAALANSGRINAARLDMETGRLNHSGHTTQTGSQDLAIEAANLHNRAGGLIGYTPIDSGNNGASDQGNSSHPSAPPTTATGGGRTESAPAPTAPQALPAGRISVSDGLDNSGSISANGNTDLSTHQSLSNQGGLNLNRLSAAGRSLSNTSGRISAHSADIRTDTFRNHSGSLQSSDGLNIHTQTLDNHQGTLQSAGSLHINSTALRNPSGRIAAPSISLAAAQHLDNTGGGIDAERLNIKAQTLDNQSGHIRSNEFTELNLSDGLANHGGQISSAGQLSIHDNQQNTLSIRNLGEILAGEDARIQAQSLANSGRLAAGRDLSIALQHNFSSQADIEAGRRLSIESAGRLNNRHTLQGGESVHLSATDIDNSTGGNIQSGSTTRLSAAQSLSNRGLINSNGLTLIEAGTTLLNSGSGRIYGNHVALAATDLINRDEQEKSAAIAARRQLDIGAQNITNQEGALLSSEGRLNIGGRLGNTHEAEGSAHLLDNNGAEILSQSDMQLAADTLLNRNSNYRSSHKEVAGSRKQVMEYVMSDRGYTFNEQDASLRIYTESDISHRAGYDSLVLKDGSYHEDYTRTHYTQYDVKTTVDSSRPARIVAGGSLRISGADLTNDKSHILAAGELYLPSAEIKNLDDETAKYVTVKTGAWRDFHHVYYNNWGKKKDGYQGRAAPADAETIKEPNYKLNIFKTQSHYTGNTALAPLDATSIQITTLKAEGSNGQEIRAVPPDTRLPSQALFHFNSADNPRPLIETDSAFTNYKQWLSSDYMLKALNVDPEYTHKRLGDGYYEQKLVNEQIARLTGKSRLDGYSSNEAQFQALMNSGIAAAKSFNLIPGIDLSAEQVSRLTDNIIWMVRQTAADKNGNSVEVLVPKVYAVAQTGAPDGAHGLIAGASVHAEAAAIDNRATITGRDAVSLGAQNIAHSGEIYAERVLLQAGQDLNIAGGKISADHAASLYAGHNLNLQSTTTRYQNQNSNAAFISEDINKHAVIRTTGKDSQLTLYAGNDLQAQAAAIASAGSALLAAENRINIGAVHTGRSEQTTTDAANRMNTAYTADIGSSIQAAADLRLQSGSQTQITASALHSDGTLRIDAGAGLAILSGQTTHSGSLHTETSSKNALSSRTETHRADAASDAAVSSSLSGNEIMLLSGSNIRVDGSQIMAENHLNMQAAGNIDISATRQHRSLDSFDQTQKSGLTASLSDGVASAGYSKSRQSLQQSGASESLALSQIDSLKGNTTLVAGESLDINAGRLNAGGDLILQGREVGLNAAHITDSSHTAQQSQQSGLSVGITYGPVKAAKSAYDKSMAGSQNSGSAVGKWFAHDIAILKASQAAMSPTVITGGRSRSSADKHSSHTQAVVSEAAAGGKLLIQATGGSIRSEGAQMSAEGDALLHARDHINLGFARSSQSQTAGSRRSGFSIDTRDHSTPGGTFNDSGSGQAAIDQAAGSSLSVGGAATLQTQSGDINILGSSLVSQHDLALNSAGKVNILSTQSSQSMSERQISSGIGSAQISDTEYFSGWMKNTQNQRSSQVEQLKSQIGSLGGNVHIQAAGAYAQQAADVSAARDIDIRAQSIDIAAGRNLGSSHQSERDVKIGSFAKVSSPLIDLVNAVEGAAKSKAEGRTRALQGMAAAAQGYQAYDALSGAAAMTSGGSAMASGGSAMTSGGGAIAKAEAGVGFKTANHSQNQSHAQSLGNSLAAGGHLNLQATAGDIRLQHTDAKAGGKLALDAAQNIVLESGQSQQHLDGKNSSTGLSVGMGASVGAQTGLYVYAEAGASKGKNRFDAQNHSHTTLAADSIQLRSGGDTTLKGATATANRIDADIKGRLNIESVQDQMAQESKQSGGGVRVQISLGTAWEASGNFNQSKSSGSSQSVNQQSGLFAGEGGYHINAQSVHLKGGAIASTAPAEQNALTTHDFSYENISNHSSGSAGSMGIGINQNMLSGSKYAVARGIIEDQIADSSESKSDHSTTYSVLSEGVFKISSESGQRAAESIRKDLEGAHRKLDAVDVRQMLTNVEAKRDAKGQLTDLALTLSDEAYDKMFAASADLYVLEKDKDGKTITDGTDKYGKELPKYRKLTDEEKQNLQAGKGGKITVFNNGIFTDINSAAQYADQHNSDAQYFIYFPQTSNAFSEMLVAGYMKFMENDFMGLTNATQETRAIMAKYGQDGVHFDGHSRGAMTTGNALESLAKDKTQLGQLPSLTVNFVGPAYNVSKADNLLSSLQGRENMSPEQAAAAELKYQSHQADTVGGLIGWNKPTGGNLSEGKAIWQEWKDMMKQPATVHSCYGKGNWPCGDKQYWKDSPNTLPEWKPASFNTK